MEIKQELVMLNGKKYLLDIEQAKKLDLLKEKDSRVRSWEEFVRKYDGFCGYSYSTIANMITRPDPPIDTRDQLTSHEAKSLAAFSKLLKLRRDWIGEWEPDWEDRSNKYIIQVHKNSICFGVNSETSASLSFPTYQMAQEFLETFRDLIEEAKILI